MTKQPKRKMVSVDSRGRVHLGDLAKHQYYFLGEDEDGALILEPAIVLRVMKAKKQEPVVDERDRAALQALDGPVETRLVHRYAPETID